MCCGVVPILFGCFLSVPSLHALVFIPAVFCFIVFFFRNIKREERWERKAKGRCMIKYKSKELWCSQRTENHHKFKCFQVK